ncbi:hypothetical protein FP74_gp078 [Bacillus phage CAM003]|uniref:Uncharacterized protein n=4 Tax=Bastillevirus TaxID=1918010 RepID=A0A024B0T9_9CAUD|nr:hypothetical protein FP73_gp077 [Bacillus phage Hoody T]YP_009035809.1 hypothetical protein FP76_gp082 [Bacillus phage Evoli]YP_009037184.1 hypothetical protein FP74_gp078 [Bacillus phage CAM003]AMW62040.1 hypothetical protein DNAM5_297 [Bacillus phage Vinny]AHZ09718.1 hypothetical protein [Bacillus phage CAM003]AHZ10012.1 hypothetical protein [Bacillus phage Evoli]AHZ10576.1 hypothetical protein [Bacillus phage Hoody T]
MAKIEEIEKGRYMVVLSQAELNTISLLLGDYDGDDYIRDIGAEFEDYPHEPDNENNNYVTGIAGDDLYNAFKNHRTIL